MNRSQAFIHLLVCGTIFAYSSVAYAENFDLTDLSIEQLMESKVSTVTRTDQKFSDTASAVYVITQNDIQRSGVTNIPDVLRMAPGVQVAKISSSEWAITARGFNGRFANKLLVLLDGRTVYSPTFAGVRWENLDLILNDIERIEVIRGSGASVWGHNAVNGVINIITKHTEDTQQGLVSVTAGNEEHVIVGLSYGDQLDTNTHYRVFGKFLRRDESIDLQENNANDDRTQGRGGFRVDWNSLTGDQVMIEGDGYITSKFNEGFLLPADNQFNSASRQNLEQQTGASVLARWDHDFSVASRTHTQFYYEYFNEDDSAFGREKRNTFDLDFQHNVALSKENYFNWGLGYRFVASSLSDGDFVTVDPKHQDLHWISAFLQDKIIFFDDTVHITFGTKIQYYTLSGWDYQPSVRLMWKPHSEHRVWAAFSRATRSPSRGETALSLNPLPLPGSLPLRVEFQANPEFDEEQVYSYELGYRGWLGNQFSFDLAIFYNEYEDLFAGTFNQFTASIENSGNAKTWGIETAVDWRPINSLRFQVSYGYLRVNVRLPQQERPRNEPENQFSFRSSYDISPTVAFDLWVRYVDSIQTLSAFSGIKRDVDSYVGLDLRLAWKPFHNLEFSIIGQNLNNRSHIEYVEEIFGYPRQVERSVYGKIQWAFD